MIAVSLAMLFTYSASIETEAAKVSQQRTEETAIVVKSSIESYKSKVLGLATRMKSGEYEDEEDFRVLLNRTARNEEYKDLLFLRFFKDGVEYDVIGNEYDQNLESPVVLNLIEKRVLTCAGVIADSQYDLSVCAFCVPIDDFEYADSLLVCFSVGAIVDNLDYTNEDFDKSRFLVTASEYGEVVTIWNTDEELNIQPHENLYSILEKEINNKEFTDEIKKDIDFGTSKSYIQTISGEKSIITVATIDEYENTSFVVAGYFRASDIYASGYFIIRSILGEFIIFFSMLLLVMITLLVQTAINRKKLLTINDIDPVLDCPTRVKFERDAEDIIKRNPGTTFAVVVIDINHYNYFLDKAGQESVKDTLLYLKQVYSKMLQLDETMGFVDNGKFVLLLHYRELAMLANRLNSCVIFARKQNFKDTNFKVELIGGIYITNKKITSNIAKMVDLAIDAEKMSQFDYDFSTFRIYNETKYNSSVENDYVEIHMESALANHDFKVFYQAKYNILDNKIDGCEALVRWYNSEINDYMQPSVFLPLFETNKFIVKLDHYVFEQVCLYVEDAIENGLPLVPISVNASRITATETDFVEYYINLKKKHNIADNFITIEFTESFAFEDYALLRDIVVQLHKAGFKCSIDDFGSGFSSYNLLKELPMDEIKLDRFFIQEGYSTERDDIILKSIISLGKSLHMKVTQEGVETPDQLSALRKLGCNVIQGYLYSKPLALTDYIGFLSADMKI